MKYIIIVGCGRTGRALASELSLTDNVVVIDKDVRKLNLLGDDFNGKKIVKDALDVYGLEAADIQSADILYLLTANDNLNIVVGNVVKRKYGTQQVVMQVNDAVKQKIFSEPGLLIINRTTLYVDILKKTVAKNMDRKGQ